MVHRDHVSLIEKSIKKGGIWADFGSGEGAFTLALRDVAGEDVEIYSIDADSHALQKQKNYFAHDYPGTSIQYIHANFTSQLEIPKLDGIIMANSLHYLKDQTQFLVKIKDYLKPEGKLVIVEYNTNKGNTWVPYALAYKKFHEIAKEAGYKNISLLKKKPSDWLADFYSAEATL